jgi:Ca-activated chloride channel family protein
MSFADPLVLLGLLAIPLLVWVYQGRQRLRARAAAAFVAPTLTPSVAPSGPGWRRHAPMLAFAGAIAILVWRLRARSEASRGL